MKRAVSWGVVVCCIGGVFVSSASAQNPVFDVRIAAINGNRIDDIACVVDGDCPGDATCDGSSRCTLPNRISIPDGDVFAPGDSMTFEVFASDWGVLDGGFCKGLGTLACSTSPETCPTTTMVCQSNGSFCTADPECAPSTCVSSFCVPGPLTKGYQVSIDPSTFTSGTTGSFDFTDFPCTSDPDCGHGFADPTLCTCALATCDLGTGLCNEDANLFIQSARSDYMFLNMPDLKGRFATPRVFGAVLSAGVLYDGIPKYTATFILTSSADATGEFTLSLLANGASGGSQITDDLARVIGVATAIPAVVEFEADVCQGVTCPPDPSDCTFYGCVDVAGVGTCEIMNRSFGTLCTDDGDLCTTDKCGFAGTCDHQGLFCPIGQSCDPADGMCKVPPAGCDDIVSSSPENCAIDARQPHSINSTTPPFGWDSIDLDFDMACDTSTLTAADFTVDVIPGVTVPPVIISVTGVGNTATVTFDGPIPPKNYTCVTHNNSGVQVCLGYLPGDVNGGGVSNASDITALVDHLNNVNLRPIYQTDMNRGGVTNASDLTRLIDLLNGANAFSSFNQVSIGAACPSGL